MKKIMLSDRYGLTQAVLGGRKTMTRRTVHKVWINDDGSIYEHSESFYKIGEVVAVAQSYESMANSGYLDIMLDSPSKFKKEYCGHGYTNKMFVKSDLMPHKIKITDIKVERLQDISDEDCLKEGISMLTDGDPMDGYFFFDRHRNIKSCYNTPREAFAALIDKVSGKGTWDSNPYVFAYSFELNKGGDK